MMKATGRGNEEGENRRFILKSSLYTIILLILRFKKTIILNNKKKILYDPNFL